MKKRGGGERRTRGLHRTPSSFSRGRGEREREGLRGRDLFRELSVIAVFFVSIGVRGTKKKWK